MKKKSTVLRFFVSALAIAVIVLELKGIQSPELIHEVIANVVVIAYLPSSALP